MRVLLLAAAALAAGVLAGAAAGSVAGSAAELRLTPVGRLPFPERGYVVDLPRQAAVGRGTVEVRENGRPVRHVDVAPLGDAGVDFGVVLAIDASKSMTGRPLAAAVGAARTFVGRRDPHQQVGIVAFNGSVAVLEPPTADGGRLARALSAPPEIAFGTRIFDAVEESLRLLAAAKLSSGSIVVLSDGADVGSTSRLEDVVAAANARHVRIFAVGLRSRDFSSAALERLAAGTGGSYAEASSPGELGAIYDALSRRLSGEYLVRYRSDAAPQSLVAVSISVEGIGVGATEYVAPTPAGLKPYRRSLAARFLASDASLLALGLLVAGLVAFVATALLRPRRRTLVERVEDFSGTAGVESARPRQARVEALASRAGSGLVAWLERDLEIARIGIPAGRVLLLTAGGTALMVTLLALAAPVFGLLGLIVPFVARAVIARRLRRVRDEFAEQLAPNLQILASALRTGHSFVGALQAVVDNAHEPSRSELRRVLTDEQLGVPLEEALQRVAERMRSRDLEQVALLAELQRTAGGNAAEVLDTVVGTLRERADIRRLVRTLTAQGRMARWILSSLPAVAGLGLWLLQREAIEPLFTTSTGQTALVVAALMVAAGSLVIQKLVEIEV